MMTTHKQGAAMLGGPRLKAYYRLTKPGIIYGNVMTAAAGFLLASKGHIDLALLVAAVGGIALVIACGCVFNNYIDRGIDQKMKRTQKRALVTGDISGQSALIFGSVLGMLGFLVLSIYVNALTVVLGVVALVFYVVLYGFFKRRSVHGTLVGSIPGALPITAGYTAVTGSIDSGAVLLFLIMAVWQMPHFYAIATYRRDEYAEAGLPILTVKKGIKQAKIQIALYIAAYVPVVLLLTVYGYTGYAYLVVMAGFALTWLWKAAEGFRAKDDARWARKLFGFSLLVLLALSFMISVDHWLP